MSCNGWNHPPDCTCDFRGGHTSSGGTLGGSMDAGGWEPRTSLQWRTLSSSDEFAHPTRCPMCGAVVYFIRHNGGSVWLDDLGAPWPKHACFDTSAPGTVAKTASVLSFVRPGGALGLVAECGPPAEQSVRVHLADHGDPTGVWVRAVENLSVGQLVVVVSPTAGEPLTAWAAMVAGRSSIGFARDGDHSAQGSSTSATTGPIGADRDTQLARLAASAMRTAAAVSTGRFVRHRGAAPADFDLGAGLKFNFGDMCLSAISNDEAAWLWNAARTVFGRPGTEAVERIFRVEEDPGEAEHSDVKTLVLGLLVTAVGRPDLSAIRAWPHWGTRPGGPPSFEPGSNSISFSLRFRWARPSAVARQDGSDARESALRLLSAKTAASVQGSDQLGATAPTKPLHDMTNLQRLRAIHKQLLADVRLQTRLPADPGVAQPSSSTSGSAEDLLRAVAEIAATVQRWLIETLWKVGVSRHQRAEELRAWADKNRANLLESHGEELLQRCLRCGARVPVELVAAINEKVWRREFRQLLRANEPIRLLIQSPENARRIVATRGESWSGHVRIAGSKEGWRTPATAIRALTLVAALLNEAKAGLDQVQRHRQSARRTVPSPTEIEQTRRNFLGLVASSVPGMPKWQLDVLLELAVDTNLIPPPHYW